MRVFELKQSEAETTEVQTILSGLSESQRQAAGVVDGPVMIVAGAGSGKTRTLTYRIAHLLAAGKARPWQILALTFTNKAAREMQNRIRQLVGEETASGLWMGTFHSVFSRILRREADVLGYTRDYTIYDQEDSERVVRNIMNSRGLDAKECTPRTVQSRISSAKNRLLTPGEYLENTQSRADDVAAEVFGIYDIQLRRSNAMDFDDLLIKPIELFDKFPDRLAAYQERWQYIHIDEYQDTNRAQYVLTKMLAAAHENICVVGDDAQSIYAFRGADIRNILDFKRDYPQAEIVRLEQNYRSTRRILNLADSVIKHNTRRIDKTLWTENQEGETAMLLEALSEKDEAQKVERWIRDLQLRDGYPYKAFAVLYRTNAQSRSIEDALRRAGIPYQLVGGVAFYRRREIKDVLAYLRIVVNPRDDESLRRIINTPTRGIGDRTLSQVEEFARREEISIWDAIERLPEIGLSSRAGNAVAAFRELIQPFISRAGERDPGKLAKDLIHASGIPAEFRGENTLESLGRLENVQELLNAVAEFVENNPERASLTEFLQEVSLIADVDNMSDDDNKVTLMTLHASKGLEFPVVFITGLEEGLFPMAGSLMHPDELEEERRLLYVGITRAEQRLFLTYAKSRFRFGEHTAGARSRFLEEMDQSLLRMESGRHFEARPDRFTLGAGSSGRYEDLDTHYWRKEPRRAPSPPTGRRVVYDAEESGPLSTGMRVEHDTFGEGKVLSVDGRGEKAKAVVFFPSVGQKKLLLRFARLRRIG